MSNTIEVDLSLQTGAGPAPIPNEGVFWFLSPLFDDLAESHGKRIDLYGDVEFRIGEMALLDRLISAARERCASMPDSWDERVGETSHPPPKREVSVRVSQSEVSSWLAAIERVVAQARKTRASVSFVGD